LNIKKLLLESPISPHFIARNSLSKYIIKYAKLIKGGKLIDIGCGEKPYEKYFDVEQYIGLEIRCGGHEEAKKTANIFFDGKILPFDNGSINWILCTEVLEHISEPGEFLKEFNRVLTPAGGVILSTPQTWGLHEEPYDFYRYTKYGLKYLFEKNGFEVVHSAQTTGIWGTVGQRLAAHLFYRFGLNIVLKMLVALIVCMPLQILCLILDFLNNYEGDTLDNVVFAKKIL
jgi:SAM-dependent methyltransferase